MVNIMKLCSFLPSATEIIYELGLSEMLYGVTHECNYPKAVIDKPKVVKPRFETTGLTGREIDHLVSNTLAKGETLYEIDEELVNRIQPDFVFTQALCEVCAVSYDNVSKSMRDLGIQTQIVSLDPHRLIDVLKDITEIGDRTGTSRKAETLVDKLETEIANIRSLTSRIERRPKVACLEWLDPLMVAGHWVPDMVSIAGSFDGLNSAGSSSKRIDLETLIEYSPEYLLIIPCGMNVEDSVKEVSLSADLSQWKDIPAVIAGNVFVADADGLFSRSGPRLIEGIQLIAQILNPQLFNTPLASDKVIKLDPI
mgnify:CR=1 FL=1